MQRTLWIALLLLTVPLVGCIGGDTVDEAADPASVEQKSEITRVQDRHEMGFTIDDEWSKTLEPGEYEILPGFGVRVNVPLAPTEGIGAATSSAEVHMGIFLPEIPGCNWEELGVTQLGEISLDMDLDITVPEQCQVPVVADAGPYYSSSQDHAPVTGGQGDMQLEGDSVATEPAARLGGFLIEQLVPHGYAVAQVSVFGTGRASGICRTPLDSLSGSCSARAISPRSRPRARS
ncbi:MAG: CocE/NonD family hydrolase [Candidatus Thermoplasmatota archaeon]|nr:CocE/NonD family hydrolase [Candidatus Thermoplasmatota archaeon]